MKKFITHIFVFCLALWVASYCVAWILDAPSRKAISDNTHKKFLKWNAIKDSSLSFDNIILGSSRGYCAYNPLVIDGVANTSTFNLCTSLQNSVESYYILKETLRYQKPKLLIYEVFIPSFQNSPDYYNVMSNASFMSTAGKWDMVLNGFKAEGLLQILNPVLKHKPYFKLSRLNPFNTEKPKKNDTYWVNGYLHDERVLDAKSVANFSTIYTLDDDRLPISLDDIETKMDAIIELCKENNIELICVRAPYPKTRLTISPADSLSVAIKELLNDKGIEFFDFNYVDQTSYEDTDFSDHHHMNVSGATKVSKRLGKIIADRRRGLN